MRKLLYIVMIFIGVSACTSRQESKPYDWDDDLHQRLLADFCLTESQVKDYIRKYIPRLASNITPVGSPLMAHCRLLRDTFEIGRAHV